MEELVANYSLCEMWLDTPIYIPPNHSFAFYEAIYAANPEILVNQRIGNGFGDIGIPGDNIIPDEVMLIRGRALQQQIIHGDSNRMIRIGNHL